MPLVINTNTAASAASMTLSKSNAGLQKSLARLSSGSKIVSPDDDAGGLAVSMKLSAKLNRTNAVKNNLANSQSFLQTQDGALKASAAVLDRMSELKMMYEDITKSDDDKANYNTEFAQLQLQLEALEGEKFNGVALFAAGGNTLQTPVTEDGGTTIGISQADLDTTTTAITNVANDLSSFTVSTFTDAIQSVATMRAINGATSSRLNFTIDLLGINSQNLEAANSRIIDTDIASESTAFARYNILVQSGTAMLAQANASSQAALRLLG